MRVALTGGATGIGAEVVAKLKAAGHEVHAFDITEPEGVDNWIPIDMSDADSIDAAVAAVQGPYDALINNAGLPPRDGLEEKILLVNYIGLHHFLNGMLDRLVKNASIVNVASRAGAMWRDNLDAVKSLMRQDAQSLPRFIEEHAINPTRAYNLSKEALIVSTMAQTEHLLTRHIRINSVSPAAVSTGILKDFAAAFGEKMEKNLARTGRPGNPDEVAEVIVFLASPSSHWIKGQDIIVDGGMSAMNMSDALGLRDAYSILNDAPNP